MKCFLCICLCMAVFCNLAGCKQAASQPVDAEFNKHQIGFVGPLGQMIAKGPDGYYFLAGDFLFYADPSLKHIAPLCDKPNCLHQNEHDPTRLIECSAYVCGTSLGWQDDSLYITGTPLTADGNLREESLLMRVEPDGSKREIVTQLPGYTTTIVLHNGYLYHVQNHLQDESGQHFYGVWRSKLSDLKHSELVYSGCYENGIIHYPYLIDDSLFLTDVTATADGSLQKSIRIDLDTLTAKQLYTTDEKNYVEQAYTSRESFGFVAPVAEVPTMDAYIYSRYSLEGERMEEVAALTPPYQSFDSDGTYYFISDRQKDTLSVFTLQDKKQLATVPLDGAAHMYILPGDDHFLFAVSLQNDPKILALDKTQFEDDPQFQVLLDMTFSVLSPNITLPH